MFVNGAERAIKQLVYATLVAGGINVLYATFFNHVFLIPIELTSAIAQKFPSLACQTDFLKNFNGTLKEAVFIETLRIHNVAGFTILYASLFGSLVLLWWTYKVRKLLGFYQFSELPGALKTQSAVKEIVFGGIIIFLLFSCLPIIHLMFNQDCDQALQTAKSAFKSGILLYPLFVWVSVLITGLCIYLFSIAHFIYEKEREA